MEALLLAGAHVNRHIPIHYECTPLDTAALGGHGDVIEQLVKDDASVRSWGGGCIPLIGAAGRGYHMVVDILLRAGTDVNATDSRAHSALYQAISRGHGGVVETLLTAVTWYNTSSSCESRARGGTR